MSWKIDQSLHWTDHYVEHGFAVIKHAFEPEFIEPAMDEAVRERLEAYVARRKEEIGAGEP